MKISQTGFAGMLTTVVAVIFIVTGLAKLMDLPAFRASIDTWALVPESAREPLAFLVPIAELIVGGAWVLYRSTKAYWLLGLMLVVFTSVYAVHLPTVGAPDCGCLGKLAAFTEWQSSALSVLIRNGVLFAMWLAGGLFPSMSALRTKQTKALVSGQSTARGFTLIELLITIALIALLVALLAPSLAGFRAKSMDLKTLATIRSHAAVFTNYATDNRDYFPALVDPRATSATYTVSGQPRTISGYFGQIFVWHFGLSDTYYDGVVQGDVFHRPNNNTNWLVTDFRYSASFMAEPAYWNPSTRIGPSQWRAQRATAVRFPSAKAVLADDRAMMFGSDAPAAIALTDGSARQLPRTDMNAPVVSGEGEYPGTWNVVGSPGIHTVQGVLGRDID